MENNLMVWGYCYRGVMVKALHCRIVVSSNSSGPLRFTLEQIPFGKGMNPLILPAMG